MLCQILKYLNLGEQEHTALLATVPIAKVHGQTWVSFVFHPINKGNINCIYTTSNMFIVWLSLLKTKDIRNSLLAFKNPTWFQFMNSKNVYIFLIRRSKEWVVACRRQDLLNKTSKYLYVNCRLCSEHFEDCMFVNSTTKNRLTSKARPSIFNIANAPPTIGRKRRLINREVHADGSRGT